MGTRILIILVVIVVLLAVLAVVLGANRKDAKTERDGVKQGKVGIAPVLERAFGWLSPGFDLADLTVSGGTFDAQKRTVKLDAGQRVTFTVRRKPGADPNDCRSLTLALVVPEATGPGPEALRLVEADLVGPLPKDFDPPEEDKQFLPVPPPDDESAVDLKLPKKHGECAIPVFRGGATVVLEAKRACTVEIR